MKVLRGRYSHRLRVRCVVQRIDDHHHCCYYFCYCCCCWRNSERRRGCDIYQWMDRIQKKGMDIWMMVEEKKKQRQLLEVVAVMMMTAIKRVSVEEEGELQEQDEASVVGVAAAMWAT